LFGNSIRPSAPTISGRGEPMANSPTIKLGIGHMGKRRTGIIIAYSQDANAGVIRGADGRRYIFFMRQWRSREMPMPGKGVVFYALRKGRAAYIKMAAETPAGADHSNQKITG